MDDLFRAALRAVVQRGIERPSSTNPSSPHSRFGAGGGGILEARGVQLRSAGPFVIGLGSEVRSASTFRSIGMAAWNLRGDDSLEGVSTYNPAAAMFCDGGATIRAPWGLRLIGRDWRMSPLLHTLRELEADPSSLRCCVPAFLPADIGVSSRDVPCLIALNLSIAEGELRVTAILRAMNAYGVFPHDHCLLACLCEAARAHLGLPRVSLTYYVDSLHVLASDVDDVRRVLTEARADSSFTLSFRDCELAAAIDELRIFEPRLRAAFDNGEDEELATACRAFRDQGVTWAVDLLNALYETWCMSAASTAP